jgi:transposase
MDITVSLESQTLESRSGVGENPHGGYHIHVRLNERGTAAGSLFGPRASMPPGTPVLAEMLVFEGCVLLALQDGDAIVLHVSDPEVSGSVVYFYHADGTLWRAIPLEQLNPGWVCSTYCFRGDMRKFEARLQRMRSRPARPSWKTSPTFWVTGGWQEGVVYIPLALVWRVRDWEHSPLPEPRIALPTDEQVHRLEQVYPHDVQQILALREQGVEKVTYQIGGLHLVLSYVERIGLVEAVNRYCPRQGDLSDGTVIAVLLINRLLAPRALSRIAEWVADTGLHFLLGLADPQALNYDRLADALLAVYPHWQNIAAEVTLRAVEQFQLKVETIHYDLTSVFFHGEYEGSDWVTFGYSRDKRPDKRQVNIGLSATADGEVVLPGGSGIHPGSTNDGTTMVPAHERLHRLFQRSDLLVTGDSIMHDAENMLTIARAHGRFLGATKMTPYVRRVVAGCPEDTFETLSTSTDAAGHEIKATFRRLRFTVKEKLSPAERKQVAQWRRQHGIRGRPPSYQEVHFRVRAAIILDTARQEADAQRRARRVVAYEKELKWTLDHLNQGRYYGDPEWVSGHLADLSHQFKDIRAFVKVTFTEQDGVMSLTYHRRPDRIAKAARLDGRWVLVTNQRRKTGQSVADYLDWIVGVYKNHRHVERRMRNLKSDLPIRPIYLHRDDAIVALCFVSVVALMVYTLIERDCQANPVLVEAGVRTTDQALATLHGFCLTVCLSPSGYQVFWLDTPTESQTLIWRQLQTPDPGTRVPIVRPASQEADSTENPISFLPRKRPTGAYWSLWLTCLWLQFFKSAFVGCTPHPFLGLVRCSLESYLFCYAENEEQWTFFDEK